jgi:hypothetical protein
LLEDPKPRATGDTFIRAGDGGGVVTGGGGGVEAATFAETIALTVPPVELNVKVDW